MKSLFGLFLSSILKFDELYVAQRQVRA